ncbi:TonB family protein [Pseudanabaena sp. BC1403]|uniref:TonB family protein n=1 Tax=Pseudanabaena sp. BC1403 TaxID=2043171 RepID=UPI000CD826C0|nr:TonB family protein [Pseudanabaena sp. BC1403]
MLPTEPKSELTESQTGTTVFKSAHTVVANNPMLQFANKAGGLIMQHPFWLLVVGSFGIHTVFALVAPNPIKKEELREVVVSTVPVVKLPPKPLPTNSKSNKSPLDNFFVKTMPKSGSPQSIFPDPSSSSLTTLDLDNLGRFEGLEPVADPYSIPPLTNDTDIPKFVKPQTPKPTTPKEQTPQRFTQSGQIDNTAPVKPTDNLKPEFKNGNLKKDVIAPNKTNGNNKAPDKIATTQTGVDGDRKVKGLSNAIEAYLNPKIQGLRNRKLLRDTEIAHPDALLSDLDNNKREKGVEWIPPKRANTTGKSGVVTFIWLVDPNGKIVDNTVEIVSSGIPELDDIAKEAAKGYKFNPIEDPASGVHRQVTAKYKFR